MCVCPLLHPHVSSRRYKVPTLVVGGGGYTLRNVARCWCYETGRLMGHDLPDKLPDSVLNTFNYYMDNEKLRIEVGGCRGLGVCVQGLGREDAPGVQAGRCVASENDAYDA